MWRDQPAHLLEVVFDEAKSIVEAYLSIFFFAKPKDSLMSSYNRVWVTLQRHNGRLYEYFDNVHSIECNVGQVQVSVISQLLMASFLD
jgi:hypothetical protein